MRRIRAGALAAILGGLPASGCAVVGGGSAPLDTYELSAPSADGSGPRRARMQVLVAEPTALKAFDGENIVVKTGPGTIAFLKGAQWADRLPKVVQARLAETLQNSGRFGGVGRPGEGLAIDYQVVTEIRAFEIRASGQESAHVAIHARLLNDRNGVVRAQKVFEASAPVSGSGNDAYLAGLDRAFGEVAADIAAWTASQI